MTGDTTSDARAPRTRLLSRETVGALFLMGLFVAAGAANYVVPDTNLSHAVFLPDIGVMVAIGLFGQWRRTLLLFAAAVAIEPFLLAGANPQAWTIAEIMFWYAIQGLAIIFASLRWLGRRPDFTSLKVLFKFALGVVVPITLATFTTFGLMSRLEGGSFLRPILDCIPYTFGILIVVPIAITAMYAPPPRQTPNRVELALLFGALASVEVLAGLQATVSAQFLLFPCLIAISFRLGRRATALAAAMICLQAFGFALANSGGLAPSADAARSLELQLFMLAVVFTSLPVAGAIGAKDDLREQLVEREAAAREAGAQAERAAAAKADFLATMSHELRTPLNGILGVADLLSREPGLSAEVGRKVRLISGSGQALLRVVNDVLDYSKIEAGRFEFDPRPFACGPWASETLELVHGLAADKGLEVRLQVAEAASGWFLGDSARLAQVVLNLLTNAIKFTSKGFVAVRIEAPGAEGGLRFEIQDSGIGISPEGAARLFQRFSQVDNTISRTYGGTGLGLAICKQIVELMGGRIGVDSTPGVGSTFWFEVPLPSTEPGQVASEDAADARMAARVLVVDDMALNREIARAILQEAGCEVVEADSGVAAVEMVKTQSFDVVLMDLQMPELDGLRATALIRSLPQPAAAVPIVAMTANVLPEQVQACKAGGMDGHVGKPFKRRELLAAVRAYATTAPDQALNTESPTTGTQSATAPAVEFDAEVFDTLMRAAGPKGAEAILNSLAQSLRQSVVLGPCDEARRAEMGAEAHALVSATGSLGFTGVSAAFRRLEYACGDPAAGIDEPWRDAQAQTRAVLADLDRRLAA